MAKPLLQRLARIYMLLQALNNILLGIYCVLFPSSFATFAGGDFARSPPRTLLGVGLGMVGVGVYGFAGAWTDDRRLFWVTVGLRVGFVGVMVGVGESWGVVVYEGVTAGMAAVAAML